MIIKLQKTLFEEEFEPGDEWPRLKPSEEFDNSNEENN